MDINSSLAEVASNKKNISLNKISGSGRVSRVSAKFAYLISEKYGSIFALPDSFTVPLSSNSDGDKKIPPILDKYLRVDDLVHFTAVPQNGLNNCYWKALKFSKSVNNTTELGAAGDKYETLPLAEAKFVANNDNNVISNVRGTVVEVYDKFGFVWSDLYGRIYLPLNACFTYGQNGVSEFQKLSDCFLMDDVVLFDAERQPELNGCRFVVTSIQLYQDDDKKKEELAVCSQNPLPMEYGVIAKLFPTFGFIQCAKFGNVFFTLSNFIESINEEPSPMTPTNLMQALVEGQPVQFLPTPQPEKNGCVWRAVRVQKVSDKNAIDDFTDLIDYLKLNDYNSDCSDVVMEVACQTDQSLWNAFLVGQLPRRHNRVVDKPLVQDVACQTANPPELLLLKALKTNREFREEMKAKFPDLMKYVEKTSL